MIDARPYQTEGIAAIRDAKAAGLRRIVVQLPTGTGKTIIFVLYLTEQTGRALILVHRDELVQQTIDKLAMVGLTKVGVVKAERNEVDESIVIASVQTLARPNRLHQLVMDFATVIADEAHHVVAETYRMVLQAAGCFRPAGPFLIGFTATTDRADCIGLDAVFQKIVFVRDLLTMISAGYLSDLRAVSVRLANADFNSLHTRAGDFIASETEDLILKANAPTHVVHAYEEHALGRRALVFTPTVNTAYLMAETFTASGIPAEPLDGGTPTKERRAILHRLHTGETLVVPNCAVLTEGFDEPAVSCIVVARPTRSRLLYTQLVGRGTRLFPGKPDCVVIDTVGASMRHDLMTVSSLFGLPPATLEKRTVTEAVQHEKQRHRLVLVDGELAAKQVDLFTRRPLAWATVDVTHFALSLGEVGHLHLRSHDEKWRAILEPPNAPARVLAEGLDLGYAQGIAEDFARRHAKVLVDKAARWRQDPATDKQITQLQKFGVTVPPMLSKGAAADLLTPLFARARRVS